MSCQTPLAVLVFLTWFQWDSVFSSVNSSPVLYDCFWVAFYLIWPSANSSSDFITESSWGVRTVKFTWKGSVWWGLSVSQGSHIRANTPGSMLYVQKLRHHDCISEGGTESKSELLYSLCMTFASFTVLSSDPIHQNHRLRWRSSSLSQDKRVLHYVRALCSCPLCGVH